MKTVILAPFGGLSQEVGIIYLLSNYMQLYNTAATQLSCNGLFSVCDRDRVLAWRRGFGSCLQCMSDQSKLADWSGVKQERLSIFLTPEAVEKTKRWTISLSDRELFDAKYEGFNLRELWQGTFMRRFGDARPDLNNKQHENLVRRLVLATTRAIHAGSTYMKREQPQISLIAGGDDYISASFIANAKTHNLNHVVFSWDSGSRYVRIRRSTDQAIFPCEVLLDSITTMRADVNTWPEELIKILDELLEFVGLSESQLQLPIAHSG